MQRARGAHILAGRGENGRLVRSHDVDSLVQRLRLCRLFEGTSGLTVILALCISSIFAGCPYIARAFAPPGTVYRLSGSLIADHFVDFTTKAQATEQFSTKASLSVQSDSIEVQFWAVQNGPIIAHQTVNNAGFGLDDYVEVGLDTAADGNRVYYFAVTPTCVRYQSATEEVVYRPQWHAKCEVTQGKWHATLVIPLSALRLSSARAQHWRVNFIRHVANIADDLTWAFNAQMDSPTDPDMWPRLEISQGPIATPHRSVRLSGLLTLGASSGLFPQPDGSTLTRPNKSIGIDIVQPVTPLFNLVATINPDFSNVEFDQETILPQEFPRQYVDYRPFFSEGQNFVDPAPRLYLENPPDRIFYSPSITIIDEGLKGEGTIGRVAVGVLDAQSASTRDMAYGFAFSNPTLTLRLFEDGVAADHRGLTDNTNEIGFVARNYHSGAIISAELANETGARIDNADFAKSAFVFGGLYTPLLQLEAGYRNVGPEYSPVDGFTAINDIRGPIAYASYNRDSVSSIKNWNLYLLGDRYENEHGVADETDIIYQAQLTTKRLLSVTAGGNTSTLASYVNAFPVYNGLQTSWYNQTYVTVGYKQQTTSPISLSYSVGRFGESFLQSLSASGATNIGHGVNASLDLEEIHDRALTSAQEQRQTLMRLSALYGITANLRASVSYRLLGSDARAPEVGSNLAAGLQGHFSNGDDLYISFGSPSSVTTLNRFLIKFVKAVQ